MVSEALKQAQKRYVAKNKDKYRKLNRKNRMAHYYRNRNYIDVENMGKSFKLLFNE